MFPVLRVCFLADLLRQYGCVEAWVQAEFVLGWAVVCQKTLWCREEQTGPAASLKTPRNQTHLSCVAFTADERMIGDAAKNQIAMNVKNTVFDAKRRIGRRFSSFDVLEDTKHGAFGDVRGDGDKHLVQAKFKGDEAGHAGDLVDGADEDAGDGGSVHGKEGKNAVIACPASFNDSQRQATKDVGLIAG